MARRDDFTDEPSASHLGPAWCALIAVALLLGGVQRYVNGRIPGNMPFYAAYALAIKINGNVLQTAAFRTPNVLPVYGSSELDRWVEHRADAFFSHRPTGFAVFPVGRGGSTCLMIQQKLAAIGHAARGKKVVIFLSPSWFLPASDDDTRLNANLSGAQLSAWIFRDDLSAGLKTDISRRLRSLPGYSENQGLTACAAQCLAEPTPLNRGRLALLGPLGKLQNALLEKFDCGALLWEIIFPNKRWVRIDGYDHDSPTASDGPIDWDRLTGLADPDGRPRREVTLAEGDQRFPASPPGGDQNSHFASRLNESREFGDLTLLTRVLRELEMDALFINQPINGHDSDLQGVTPRDRRVFYERIEACLRSAGYPVKNFSEHEEDRDFFKETDHPSGKAWIFYDREIDRFYSRARH